MMFCGFKIKLRRVKKDAMLVTLLLSIKEFQGIFTKFFYKRGKFIPKDKRF
ncbi:hypothetical protein bcere0004_57580 [Bacillus cereus BGSC 6E1]|nr:hypothetical protein bcere0004_57580 [Bacillus cereus BGSC 6E1]